MKFIKALLCASLVAPVTAFAAGNAGPTGYVDLFYTPSSKFDLDDPSAGSLKSDGGSGFGVRGRAALAAPVFLQGEFQSNSYDGFNGVKVDTDVDLFRAGLGATFGESPFYGLAEYVRLKVAIPAAGFSESESGYGLHLGAQGSAASSLKLYGQVGYLDVGDAGTGFEFMVGGAASITPSVALFVDFRRSKLEDDSNATATISDLRTGLRVAFGG